MKTPTLSNSSKIKLYKKTVQEHLRRSKTNLFTGLKRSQNISENNSSTNQFPPRTNLALKCVSKSNIKKETNLENTSSVAILNEIQDFLSQMKTQAKEKSVNQLIKMLNELVSLEKNAYLMSGENESQRKEEHISQERKSIAAYANFLKENKCSCDFSSTDLVELKESNKKMFTTNDQGMQTDLLRYLVKPKVTKCQYVQVETTSRDTSSQSISAEVNQSNMVRLLPRKFQKVVLENSVHEKTFSVDGAFNMSLKKSNSKKFTEIFVPKNTDRKNYDLSPSAEAQLKEAFKEDQFTGYCRMHCNQKNALFYEISNNNYHPTSYILQRESSRSNFKTCISSVKKGFFNFVPCSLSKRQKYSEDQMRPTINRSNLEACYYIK